MTAAELVIMITADSSKLNSSLSHAEKDAKSWGNKLSSWTVAKGQLIANFATKAVTKVGEIAKGLIKGAVDASAEYEQLVGGVETLFKDSANKVQGYASQAYRTVGISANEYMQNVTSFSASLLQSLSNDTDKAAEVADMAMIDMADNANKMGSSMESIQSAYQGFAKGQYQLLDNLKLGYGGTKTEMERLLSDAGKIAKRTFDIKKLSDVYEAIHVIQQEMGIAGTTQEEAMKTVAGSMNAAKAAWQDVLTAMGNGKNVKKAIKNFVQTAKTAIKNYTPVVRNAVEGLVAGVKELAPELKNLINEVGRGLFGKKWDITIEWIQHAWEDVQSAFTQTALFIGNTYQAVVEWINNGWQTIKDATTNVSIWVAKAYKAYVEWLNNGWETIKNAFNDVTGWVSNAFDATVNWIQTAWDDVSNAIAEVSKGVWDNVVNFTLGLVQSVKDFIADISKPISVAVNFVKRVIDQTGENLKVAGENTLGDDATAADVMRYATTGERPQTNTWSTDNDAWDAKGNWDVPWDNFKATLHRNEMVLTASQARRYRDGSGDVDYNVLGDMIGSSIERAMGRVNVLLSGDKVGDLTTRRIKKNINAQSASVIRGMGG